MLPSSNMTKAGPGAPHDLPYISRFLLFQKSQVQAPHRRTQRSGSSYQNSWEFLTWSWDVVDRDVILADLLKGVEDKGKMIWDRLCLSLTPGYNSMCSNKDRTGND
jgi:hypothetical protein